MTVDDVNEVDVAYGPRAAGRARWWPGGSGRAPCPVPVAADDVGVPVAGALDGAGLGGVVDVDEAEALGVAVRPLEVVQQGPGEVAGERGALAGGGGAGGQVL